MRLNAVVRPLLVPCLLVPIVASAQIFRCESADGVVEYSNTAPAAGSQKNCRRIELPELTTIPAPKPAAKSGATVGQPGAQAGAAGAADFPRVDAAAQKSRDSDRRRILQDELRREEQRLTELRQEYNGGEPERRGDERNFQKYAERVQRLKDDIARAEGNVSSLRRELGNVRE